MSTGVFVLILTSIALAGVGIGLYLNSKREEET